MYHFQLLVSTAPEWASSVYIVTTNGPSGNHSDNSGSETYSLCWLSSAESQTRTPAPDSNGAFLQWQCSYIITSNVAKLISLTPHLSPWLLHLAESITEEIYVGIIFSQPVEKWSRNYSFSTFEWKHVDLHRQDAGADVYRKIAIGRQGQDELLNCICLSVFSSCTAKSSIPQQITCLLTPRVSASLHSAPQAHLLLICFFLLPVEIEKPACL